MATTAKNTTAKSSKASSTAPPVISDNGMQVLERRYLAKNTDGQIIETPGQLFERVARAIAEGDQKYGQSKKHVEQLTEQFYNLMASLSFLPNSPTLMNAGRPLAQLSACFVLPIEDSMESIFETLKHTALIHQSGGGTGFSFSRLRPAGDIVRSSMGVSSGPVSFMEVYNAATEAIKQGGTRRGANMAVLRIDHPDIEQFITAKNDLRKVTNFNISVTVTDDFMTAVANNQPFSLKHPNTGKTVKTLPARQLFDMIVDSAWKTGEPGVVFIDEVNRHSPTPQLGSIESTNPCGEVPLLAYEACNLGSINLGLMLTQDADGQHHLDWNKLADTVALCTHFLDNVITQNVFPIPQIQAMAEGNRKIGLGVMGWADALLKLGIPYDTEEAVQLGKEVAAWMDYHSKLASVELAKSRGSFPNFKDSCYDKFNWLAGSEPSDAGQGESAIEAHCGRHAKHVTARITQKSWQQLDQLIHQHGLRNATTSCIAPTGTISIIAGASGGIEPVFALVFTRNIMDNTRMLEIHPYFAEIAKQHGFYNDKILHRIAEQGSLQGIEEIPEVIRRLFVTSFDIAPEWHVRMQAAFQQFSDNGVSKTINFPETATRDDVAKAYHLAHELGIKGITVYRNNSRGDQPMSLATDGSTKTVTDDITSQTCGVTAAGTCTECD